MTRTEALVRAAEKWTGRCPRRRPELLAGRLATAPAEWEAIAQDVADSDQQHWAAQTKLRDTQQFLQHWQQEVRTLTAIYQQQNRQQTAHCQLTRAQHKVMTYRNRLPRCQTALDVAQRRLTRHQNPLRATFRLDAGFTSQENIY